MICWVVINMDSDRQAVVIPTPDLADTEALERVLILRYPAEHARYLRAQEQARTRRWRPYKDFATFLYSHCGVEIFDGSTYDHE